MSHALLLRLFLSPSFFSVHVALKYLMLYADNIGITYYLTRRLRELDTQELRDVWGFICHLLVTRPSNSRALECFVVEIAQRSTHIAVMTLFYMQASLQDLSACPNSPAFQVCQRTLHRCHEIIFADLPSPASVPYSGLTVSFQSRFARKRVKPHVEPALVGIGLVLAGAPVMPGLTEIMGEVALQQGQAEGDVIEEKGANTNEEPPASAPSGSSDAAEDDSNTSDEKVEDDGCLRIGGSVAKTIIGARTSPALTLVHNLHRSHLSEDPLDQLDPLNPALPPNPYQSLPSIPSSHSPLRQSTLPADTLLERYDIQSQSYLLRSHYCQSEILFLLALEEISNHLLVVPKPARISALRAELTALNHKLPAEVCMPMWCSSSDTISPLPSGESVVLNSAERAPYLLHIEILHDDLDFDPTKRGNKEILKRIVTKESEEKGTSRDLIPFTVPRMKSLRGPASEGVNVIGSNGVLGKDSTDIQEEGNETGSETPVLTLPSDSTTSLVQDEQEVDLVEQLYGAGQSLRGPIDLEESIVLPPPPKNRELELVAWSRTRSAPSPSTVEQGTTSSLDSRTATSGRSLSLDDYSERMRTAAVMLAQLNASLVRETVTPLSGPPGSGSATPSAQDAPSSSSAPSRPLSWLAGSGSHGPLHPSLGGKPRPSDASPPAPTTRMRVNHAEAASIRDRIMKEMISLEEERMERMREGEMGLAESGGWKTAEDEGIIKRELSKADPSAVVLSESWATKKSRIRHASPYGHLANWDCVSVIVKTGGDLRQEQVAVQLIREFGQIWQEEKCQCWVRYFRILITGASSGLVETINDAVSIHSIKKAEYARRLAEGRLGHVTLLDHFKSTYGDPSTAKFLRAQRNFAKSLAGYSIVTYLLQIKDRHNGNILLDPEGHLIHIDFGFMLSNSPGNIGFEAAPFKLPPEYVEVLGGVEGEPFLEFKRLHGNTCDRIITLVELMQKNSTLPCFAAFGEQTANQLRDRFQPALTHSLVREYVDRLIDSSLGSNWTRLYDSFQYYSQSIL
ncbi:kinase-like protein [Pisolithus orientalis]|uniref:kinase-like protein n=1 Tax=Pisolithus orientalis TaxID=936130 RepID=UPI0022251255|nr:kinase-like protein [Pisolithus orientalis]KAI6028422.1 kinase-like protein [Pisolithus orientalis]